MKVAIVYDVFPHYREAILRELFAHSEHEFVLAADRESIVPSIKSAHLPEGMENVVCGCVGLPCGVVYQKGLIRLALRRDLDAIIYLGCPALVCTWLSAIVARITGKSVLYWTHGWTRRDRPFRRFVKRAFYGLAHSLLLYGNIAKKLGAECGFPADRMHVIYNSLDCAEHARIRDRVRQEDVAAMYRELFVQSNLPTVICTARLTEACRFDLLFEAHRILAAAGVLFNIVLVGDGPMLAALQAQSAGAMSKHVCFYGECYDQQTLGMLLIGAHVTVSPGKVGLTAMHSMAFGTPVITHDNLDDQMPEVEAVIPGHSGDFFRQGDPHALAEAIRKFIGSPKSPAISNACIEVIERFYNPIYQRKVIDRALNETLQHSRQVATLGGAEITPKDLFSEHL